MSSFYAISSNLIKKTIPLHPSPSASTTRPYSLLQTFNSLSLEKINPSHDTQKLVSASAHMNCSGPNELPVRSSPEVPTAPQFHKPGIIPEVPRRPNVPDFDAIPPENPVNPPPISPGPIPELPGPPNPSPPKPEAAQPPIPSPPGRPEVFPPHGPEVIPPKPPEPREGVPPPKPEIDPPHGPDVIPSKPSDVGFPQPDIPPPITM